MQYESTEYDLDDARPAAVYLVRSLHQGAQTARFALWRRIPLPFNLHVWPSASKLPVILTTASPSDLPPATSRNH